MRWKGAGKGKKKDQLCIKSLFQSCMFHEGITNRCKIWRNVAPNFAVNWYRDGYRWSQRNIKWLTYLYYKEFQGI